MNARRRAIMCAVAAITLAIVVHWARLPTYQLVAQSNGLPWAISNDEQLVVMVPARYIGRSLTTFDETWDAACRLVRTFMAACDSTPWTLYLDRLHIVRFESGAVSHTVVDSPALDPGVGYYTRFVDGRLYVPGGVWTGRTLEPVSIEEQRLEEVSTLTG